MIRLLAVIPIALLVLSGCSYSSEAPNATPGPASAYTPGTPGAPAADSPEPRSGLGDSGGGAGSNGRPTNPAQND